MLQLSVLISKDLTDSYTGHDELVLGNNVLKEYDDLKDNLKFRKKTQSKNSSVSKIKKGKPMFLSKYAVFDSKKLRFIKEQEAR